MKLKKGDLILILKGCGLNYSRLTKGQLIEKIIEYKIKNEGLIFN